MITEPTGGTPDAVTRFPGTTATSLASWFGGELVDTNNVASQQTYDVTRPGTNMPNGAYLTPGSANYPVSTAPPSVTSGGSPASYTVGGSPVAVDSGVKVVTGTDADITSAAMVLTNPQSGDTLNFSSQNGITGSYSSGTLTLGGTATVADYQTALQSVTFSNSNTTNPSTTPRLVTVQADDSAASPTTSDTVTDTVDVTIPAPTVTAGGAAALYTAGANAVTVDGGIQVNSDDTSHMTGATMVLGNAQSGDTLNFSSQNNITGSYSSGTLTLGGTATTAQYQTALQSVTFNSSNTSTQARSISVQVDDSSASPSTSSTAADTVDVYAPAQVTALYVKGTGWAASMTSYLGSHTLGNSATPTLGYALQTGANQSKDLPWVNMNVIEATFSEAVNVSESSLVLTGASQSGYSTPSVTGFSSLGGNTYAWTLSSSLTANRLEISFLSTGAHAVTDSNGAGLSGNWTGGSSTFPSGDGLAGTASGPNSGVTSDFNFLFNALPGDAARNGVSVNSTDYLDVKNKVNQNTSSANYTPYYDVAGSGSINSTSYLDVKNRVGQSQAASSNAPAPQDSGVGGLTTSGDDADLTGAMLAVQEGSTGQTGGGPAPAASNQTSGGTTSTSSGSGSISSRQSDLVDRQPGLGLRRHRRGRHRLRPGGLVDLIEPLAVSVARSNPLGPPLPGIGVDGRHDFAAGAGGQGGPEGWIDFVDDELQRPVGHHQIDAPRVPTACRAASRSRTETSAESTSPAPLYQGYRCSRTSSNSACCNGCRARSGFRR